MTEKKIRNVMSSREVAEWMNKHTKDLERKFPGKWVAIRTPKGVVAVGTLNEIIEAYKKKYPKEAPFVHLVPRKEEKGYIL